MSETSQIRAFVICILQRHHMKAWSLENTWVMKPNYFHSFFKTFSQMCSAKQIHFLFHDYTQPRQWSENYILFQVTLPNIIWSLSIIHGILHVILFPALSGNTVLWFWGFLKFLRDLIGSEINGKWLKISCVAVFIVGKLVEMWVRGMQTGIRFSNKFSSASLLATYPVTVWHYQTPRGLKL